MISVQSQVQGEARNGVVRMVDVSFSGKQVLTPGVQIFFAGPSLREVAINLLIRVFLKGGSNNGSYL
jgi:hypothetical protein